MVYKANVLCDVYGIQWHTVPNCQANFQGVGHANAMQNSTYTHKMNPTQTHISLVRESTQISPIKTAIPCLRMLLNLLVFNTKLLTNHLPNLLNQSPI